MASALHTFALWCSPSSPCKGLTPHQLLSAHRNPTDINEKWACPATLKVGSNLSFFGRWKAAFPCLSCPIPEAKLLFSCAASYPTYPTDPVNTGDGELSLAYGGIFRFCLRLQQLWVDLLAPKVRAKQTTAALGQQNRCSWTAWCGLSPDAGRMLCWAGAGARGVRDFGASCSQGKRSAVIRERNGAINSHSCCLHAL